MKKFVVFVRHRRIDNHDDYSDYVFWFCFNLDLGAGPDVSVARSATSVDLVFYPLCSLAMLISAFVYLALVLLPLFAHFDISLRSRNESDNFLTSLAKETKSLAITYAKLMEKVIGKKA